jgi:hypothetical protein
MTDILHLGHQPSDLTGVASLISTVAGGFDPALDVNGLRISATNSVATPISLTLPPVQSDLWLSLRYLTPSADAAIITRTDASFLEIFDAANLLIAQIKPVSTTNCYHAIAHGDTSQQGSSSYSTPNAQPIWFDIRLVVGASITIELHVDGVLRSAATAPNTAAKGKPRHILFRNLGLHGASSTTSRIWYLAHLAALDGRSTIGRRFVRRSPNVVASFNQMIGSLDALKDGDLASRVASTAAGQRLSFSLTGPTGPAAPAAFAAVHLKQIAQAGTDGPQATSGFLRIGGVNHDAPAVPLSPLAPGAVYSSWTANPSDASPWSALTLPAEVGIRSA